MAQRNIDFGTFPDDPDADAIRTAFEKVQLNFTELFSGLQEQAVLSVNRTSGVGISVNSPTGNVVVNADIACVTVTTSTLSLGLNGANGNLITTMDNSTTQSITVDLPANITSVTNANFSGTVTASAFVANSSISSSNTITATGNVTAGNVSTGRLTASGNITTTANIYANAGTIGASLLTGTLTTNAQPNITSVGTLSNLNVAGSGNSNLGNTATANYFVGDGGGLTNVTALANSLIINGSSQVYVTLNGNVTTRVSGADIQVVSSGGTNVSGYGNFTGNLTAANANLGNAVNANYFIGTFYGTANSATTATSATTAGTVTTAAQPNITSVGTLTSASVTGNVTAGNVYANSGTIGASLLTGTLTTAAQPNITSVGTLTNAAVTGNVTAGNVYANSGTIGAQTLKGEGGNISNVQGANVSGAVSFATTANAVAGANVSGQVGNALVAGTVYTSAQPNITSVGTLSSVDVTGNGIFGNVYANSGIIGAQSLKGDGGNISNIQGGNVSGAVSSATSATTAGTVTTAAQPNITSVGTLSSLAVTANVTAGNVYANSGTIGAQTLKGEGGNISNIQGANVSGTVSSATTAGTVTTASQPNITSVGTLSSLGVTGNISSGNANLGNLVTANFVTGTLTTAAQPNITSVGTLTSLDVTGNVTAGNIVAPVANGNSNLNIPSANGNVNISVAGNANIAVVTGTGVNVAGTLNATGNANVGNLGTAGLITATGNVSGGNVTTSGQLVSTISTGTAPLIVSSTTQVANLNAATAGAATNAAAVLSNSSTNTTVYLTGTSSSSNANVALEKVTGIYANMGNNSITATTFVGALSGAATSATTAGTVTTASQPNITSLGTLSSLSVTGNITSGNVYANSGTIGASLLTGTLTTAAQPNVTSLGTLTVLDVNGNITAANITANTGVFTGNAAGLTNIPGGNVTGAVATATTAGTVTTASQPNITSVGTLSSLSVTGNITSGNANLGNLAKANFFQGDGSLLTNISVGAGSYIENGNSEVRVDANSNVRVNVSGTANVLVITSTGANITGTANVSGNISAGNVNATLFTGTLATASQPNVTSLGTLTGLNVAGISNLGPNSNVIITGGSNNQFLLSDGSGGVKWVTPANVTIAPGSNTQVLFNDASSLGANANLTFDKTTGTLTAQSLSVTANATAGNVYANTGTIGASKLTGSLTTASQPNITSLGTLSSLIVSGNINAGNVSGGNVVSANFITGTLTTAAQPNITSLGTLTGLGVNGNITAANITANTGVFTGNGSGLSQLAGANVTGTVANATFATTAGSTTTAGTVTTNAQPNITSVGTLTGLTVNGLVSATRSSISQGTITSNLQALSILQTWNNSSVQFHTIVANITNTNSAANSLFMDLQLEGTSKFAVNKDGNVYATGTASAGNLSTGGNLTVSGNAVITGNLAVDGNLTYLNVETVAVEDPIIQLQTGANGAAPVANSGKDVGTALNYYDTQARVAFMGWDVSNTEFSMASQSTITNEVVSITALGNLRVGNIIGNGQALTGLAGANVTGAVSYATTANSVAGANVSGQVGNALIAGTVYTAAQPNITSVGSLTSLDVTGNVTAGNVYANSGTIGAGTLKGEGGNISNIQGANVSGAVSSATTAGTVTTAAQPNITSVGTLSSLTVTGNISAGNISSSNNITSTTDLIVGNVANSTALKIRLTSTGTETYIQAGNGTNGTTGNVNFSPWFSGTSKVTINTNTGNITSVGAISATGNVTAGNVYANSGTIGASLLTGTLTTAAQPNITSVGTLTSLSVTGTATAGNLSTGGNLSVTGNAVITGNLAVDGNLTYLNVETVAVEDPIIQLQTGANGAAPVANSGKDVGSALNYYDTQARIAFMGWDVSNAEFGLASQASITNEVVTFSTYGNLRVGNIIGNGQALTAINGSNVTGQVANALVAGTVYTAAQPNITSVGTLSSVTVSANANVGNLNASGRVRASENMIIDGGISEGGQLIIGWTGVTGITGQANSTWNMDVDNSNNYRLFYQNASGATGVSLTAYSANSNIQVNANLITSGYMIRSVGTGITAAGSTQGTATAITKEMNVVSTVASGAGVVLPTAAAGMVISITNTSANSLAVYPASGAAINSGAANAAYTQPAGSTLQFIAPTTTQWYTVGATFA